MTNISLIGYENKVISLIADNVEVGNLVKMKSSNTVTKCEANEDFIGICVSAKCGYASILIGGYVELPYSQNISACGYKNIVAYDEKSVMITDDNKGKQRLIINYDDKNKKVGFIL